MRCLCQQKVQYPIDSIEDGMSEKGIETTNEERVLDIRQTAGMVFQNPDNQIVATMVEEDVAFGPENMQVPTAEIWKRVERALGSVNMTRFRHKSPLKLSGGQKQRVAIAGIIAMEPKCIVLDEPTAMLDPVGRNEVIDTLHSLNEEKGYRYFMNLMKKKT